jgi:hypothetical protein
MTANDERIGQLVYANGRLCESLDKLKGQIAKLERAIAAIGQHKFAVEGHYEAPNKWHYVASNIKGVNWVDAHSAAIAALALVEKEQTNGK